MKPAEMVVHLLMDGVGDSVVIELTPVQVDDMPHVTWMVRAVGAAPTQYLAKGTAHSREDAVSQAQEKVRLLGVSVAEVIDNTRAHA